MNLETIIFGALVTVMSGSLVIIASRKFGLPGLGREVENQQGALIATLRGRVDEEQKMRIAAEVSLKEERESRKDCEDTLHRVSRDLRLTEGELLDLYRQTGKRPPRRLAEMEHRKPEDGA